LYKHFTSYYFVFNFKYIDTGSSKGFHWS